MHRVMDVRPAAAAAGFLRFGLTGWYREERDVLSAAERTGLEAMRGKTN